MANTIPDVDYEDTTQELTTSTSDNLVGTAADDLFVGALTEDSASGLNTLNPSDKMDGMGGDQDKLQVVASGDDPAVAGFFMDNTEILEVNNYADDVVIGLNMVSGVNLLWMNQTSGGYAEINNINDEVDVIVTGRDSGEDTSDNYFEFTNKVYLGDDDTMHILVEDVDTDIEVFSAGIENVKVQSQGDPGSLFDPNYVDLDVEGQETLKVTGDTDLEIDVDDDQTLSKVNAKEFTGDLDLWADIGNGGAADPAKVLSGTGDDYIFVRGDGVSDVKIVTKGGSDDVFAYNFDDVTVKLGGRADYASIWDADNIKVIAGKGQDDVYAYARGTVTVDSVKGDTYVDVWADGNLDYVSDPLNPVVATVTTEGGDDFISVGTGPGEMEPFDAGFEYAGDAFVRSGAGKDTVIVGQVQGDVDVGLGKGADMIRVGDRGITMDDLIAGGKGDNILYAGKAQGFDAQNGFNVLSDDDDFMGVSGIQTVSIVDNVAENVTFNGVTTGANAAGVTHYMLDLDERANFGDFGAIQSNYTLEEMVGGVTLDIGVNGYFDEGEETTFIDYFDLDLDADAEDQSANINFFVGPDGPIQVNDISSAASIGEVNITNTSELNISLTDVQIEEPVNGVPGISLGFFGGFNADDTLTEMSLTGDAAIAMFDVVAPDLTMIDGSAMTASVGLGIIGFGEGLLDVADEITIYTGSAADTIFNFDADSANTIESNAGDDYIILLNDQDDDIDTGLGMDIVYAGIGDEMISLGGDDDLLWMDADNMNDADVVDGGSGTDTVEVFGEVVGSESQFMNGWTRVENLLLDSGDDSILLNAIADEAGIELVDLSKGGADEITFSSGFDNDVTVELGEDGSSDVIIDAQPETDPPTTPSSAALTVSGAASAFDETDFFRAGVAGDGKFVMRADDGTATLGPDNVVGFDSIMVERNLDANIEIFAQGNVVPAGGRMSVDASELVAVEGVHGPGDLTFWAYISEGAFDVIGGEGDDYVELSEVAADGDGNDTVETGLGDDEVESGVGDDDIDTGAGDDEIRAEDGDDIVDAGAGEDLITGGLGGDLLTGGDDDDIFIYQTVEDSNGPAELHDTIFDFEAGADETEGDKIDLSAFGFAEEDYVIFNVANFQDAQSAVNSNPGDEIEIILQADNGTLWVNYADSGAVPSLSGEDLQITLAGVNTIAATDFIFGEAPA